MSINYGFIPVKAKVKGDLGSNWFWSSSVYPVNSDLAYALDGSGGHIVTVTRSVDHFAVAGCVKSR